MAPRLSLPLKYRPLLFSTLVGQDDVARYLAKKVAEDDPRNVILAGAWGSGKTSSGRIYARALNCTEVRPNGDPCNECDFCQMQLAENFPDYHELDLSSNGSVEKVRTLVDVLRTPPTFGRRRVFLGDEAHNASKAAWDALLKITEEPPEFLVLIFSTTEANKIRPAIQSRCQSLRVSTIDLPVMTAHILKICQAEGIEMQPDGAQLIAALSKGHARDALTMLEHAADMGASGASEITRILGLDHALKVVPLAEAILENRMDDAFNILEDWPEPAAVKRGAIAEYLTYLSLISAGHNIAIPNSALKTVADARHREVLEKAEAKSRYKQERAPVLLNKLNIAIMTQPVATNQATVLSASIVILDYINTNLNKDAGIGTAAPVVANRRRQFATVPAKDAQPAAPALVPQVPSFPGFSSAQPPAGFAPVVQQQEMTPPPVQQIEVKIVTPPVDLAADVSPEAIIASQEAYHPNAEIDIQATETPAADDLSMFSARFED